ncbi:MAG: cytochrome c3 family protein [Magnetococcus sp. THC-1_WYH]
MKRPPSIVWIVFFWVLFLPGAVFAADPAAELMEKKEVFLVTKDTDNKACLYCHGVSGFSAPMSEGRNQDRKNLFVDADRLAKSVHGSRSCVDCHSDITKIPHDKNKEYNVSCVQCHTNLNNELKVKEGEAGEKKTLGHVVENIASYLSSVHAQPRKGDPNKPNAYCSDCHTGHAIFAKGTPERKDYHMNSPAMCGRCHEKQLLEYEDSLHGGAVLRLGDEKFPVCGDCHTTHKISHPESTYGQLVITKSCGGCHKDSYESYTSTYHGQVNTLGYVNTAKCFDCHEAHKNRRVTDPESSVHPDNRGKTCKQCHENVSPGFLSFQPHGNNHSFDKYPEMWLASKGMIGLLVGVFAVFWTHTFLWFLRERKEKKLGIHHKLPQDVAEAPLPATGTRVNVQRFPALWRLAHITFALSIMVLAATGLTVLFADSFWAQTVAKALGGAKVMAIIHRVAGAVFIGVFFIHLVAVLHKLLIKNRATFEWFGPNSLVPRWQDLWDLIAMLKWFFGKGPKPYFDHWTYWEKFDYWAPFWGVSIIGGSGLVLWFPVLAGEYLPGWIFNVATIFHGEEAVLAVIFIFSVHFFNCHLRPSKFPLDIMMFVGNMPMEEFKEERTVEFQRMVQEGTLAEIMVEPPTSKAKKYSRILGFTLIGIGLTLLFFALTGIGTHLVHFFSS